MAAQWHPVLDQALAETAVVGVAEPVRRHLGRRPTKSEITAARRAARRYRASPDDLAALRGRRPQVSVPGAGSPRRRPRRRPVTASSGRRDCRESGQALRVRASRTLPAGPESLLTQVSHATRAAQLLPVSQLEPAHAKLLAEDLTEVVAGLATLAANLIRRSRQHIPTDRSD